jgi:hypothetical protein
MSLALQTQRITGNDTATFTFDAAIGAYVYAIQQLNFQFDVDADRFQRIGVALAPQGGGVGSNELTLDQRILLDGALIGDSWTEVTVLAWLGAENPAGIFMQNQNGLDVGGVSQPLATGGEAPLVAAAAIAGFDFTFSSDRPYFLGLGVSCGAVQDLFAAGDPAVRAVAAGSLTGSASFSGSVDAALLALTAPQPGTAVDVVGIGSLAATATSQVGPYLDGQTLGSAALFIQSFFAQFPIEAPTSVPSQLQIGSPASGIELNFGRPGAIRYEGTQVLKGPAHGAQDPIIEASNLQTNSLLVALAH